MNERWASLIIDQLVSQGVTYFCLSPGSRSTLLTLAIAEHPKATSFVHFDERGMAFHALGVAKATGKPVALLVTSGTAVGNLFPAVMEASHSNTPLIVLTADRPPELRDNGANQTTDQVKIFGDYVRWQVDLPCPSPELSDAYVGTTIAHAVYRSRLGPVHLNCMFREPFFGAPEKPIFQSTRYADTLNFPSPSFIAELAAQLNKIENGVIIAGAGANAGGELADRLGWPVFADILSGARGHIGSIPYFDSILKLNPDLKTEAVIHLGDRYVSKTLLEWVTKQRPTLYCHVANHPYRHDPSHLITHRVETMPPFFCAQLLEHLKPKKKSGKWEELSKELENYFASFFTGELSEPGLIRSLPLNPDWALFLANSMPIRDANNFLFPKYEIGPIFANRGVSGIDGNIATAIGIAQGAQKPTLAVLGDLTALHDLNSLAQLKKAKYPVVILIFNNGGGGIFSFLPVAQKKEFCEEYIATAHTLTFEHAANMFGLPYYKNSLEALGRKESCIIEVVTNREENYELHTHIHEQLSRR